MGKRKRKSEAAASPAVDDENSLAVEDTDVLPESHGQDGMPKVLEDAAISQIAC